MLVLTCSKQDTSERGVPGETRGDSHGIFFASFLNRQARPVEDGSQQNSEVEESWDSPSEEEEVLYSASPPYNQRQMKRMSGKHQRNSQMKSAGRSPIKGSF